MQSFVGEAGEAVGEPFPVRRGVLFESRLGPQGASYREVATFSLSDDPAAMDDGTEGEA
jgi:2'-5' RNA ligase